MNRRDLLKSLVAVPAAVVALPHTEGAPALEGGQSVTHTVEYSYRDHISGKPVTVTMRGVTFEKPEVVVDD